DDHGEPTIKRAALGDLDSALRVEGDEPIRTIWAPNNVMWRSPEMQTSSGVAKPSDVFSFGLVCIYALGGGPMLPLPEQVPSPEFAIIAGHFRYFGPLPEGLILRQVHPTWRDLLERVSKRVEDWMATED
ncbi:hypothetical protein QBC46DRAFT_226325, partial [Diplogelasinospora grovesii]